MASISFGSPAGRGDSISILGFQKFEDKTSSTVEATTVFGRADPIFIRGSATRTLSITVRCTQEETKTIINTANTMLYRAASGGSIVKPYITRLDFFGAPANANGPYLGYLKSITFTDDTVKVGQKLNNGSLVYDISIEMDVIHTYYPGQYDNQNPPNFFGGSAQAQATGPDPGQPGGALPETDGQ